ncbi:MAG: hypothetical protein RJA66_781 [Actinomycetota bacterium]
MKVLNHKGANGANEQCADTQCIESDLGFHVAAGFGVISLEAKPAKLSSLTAAGSWGFTGANLNPVAELVTLEFAGVNGSSVVATGGHGRPSADSLGSSNNGQRVSNIDVDDLVPTDCDRSEWVGYDNAFIEDFHLWLDENQVGTDAEGERPQASRDGQQGAFGQPEGYGQERAEHEHEASQHKAASRPKDLFISHVSIIAGEK